MTRDEGSRVKGERNNGITVNGIPSVFSLFRHFSLPVISVLRPIFLSFTVIPSYYLPTI